MWLIHLAENPDETVVHTGARGPGHCHFSVIRCDILTMPFVAFLGRPLVVPSQQTVTKTSARKLQKGTCGLSEKELLYVSKHLFHREFHQSKLLICNLFFVWAGHVM